MALILPTVVWASDQPFIDSIRNQLPPPTHDSFIEEAKKRFVTQPVSQSSPSGAIPADHYSQSLKDRGQVGPGSSADHYTVDEKARLGPVPSDSVIADIQSGDPLRGRLKEHIPPYSRHHFGFKYVLSAQRRVYVVDPQEAGQPFAQVYGQTYAPDLALHYEYLFLSDATWGSLGSYAQAEVAYFSGYGQFAFPLRSPAGGTFPLTTAVRFQYFVLPLSLGLAYHLSIWSLLQPYARLAYTQFLYSERRNDGGPAVSGGSRGTTLVVGLALSLDAISHQDHTANYQNYGINHVYLTLDYARERSFSGPVSFNMDLISLGITFGI